MKGAKRGTTVALLALLIGWAAAQVFVRPGLVVKIAAAAIAADGTITAEIRVTDPRGLPLDREGNATPGAVALSLVAAVMPKGDNKYTSYTTRVRVDAASGRQATQAAADASGTFTKVSDGVYRYTFRTKAPANFDRTATHTIGVYSNRNLSEFGLPTSFASDVFHFVPAGGAPGPVRDVVPNEACNGCHGDLNGHGGSRRGVAMCVLCHQPQTSDPVTGNTVDLGILVHKIHSGADLPSVRAGGKYVVVRADYSQARFPASGGVSNCGVCHRLDPDEKKRPAQAMAHLTRPSRAACGSCHDDVNFATGAGHHGVPPQSNDLSCARCHIPQGDGEFDASTAGAHAVPNFSETLQGVVLQILRVDDGVAGKQPVVTFSVKDRTNHGIPLTDLDRLTLYVAGPASDYLGQVNTDAKRATATGDGIYRITFPTAIAANARGTYRVSLAGRKRLQLLPGTDKARQADDIAANAELSFSVDGSRLTPRRKVVETAKCNACHVALTFHGTQNSVEQCAVCHTADLADANSKQTAQFTAMIHRIHSGRDLGATYQLGGTDWSHVSYPGVRSDCTGCHVNNSQQLPLPAGLRDIAEPAGPLPVRKPEANACTSCHGSSTAAAHVQANTATLGEACSVCHGPNSEFSVDRVHAH